ncbi:hypothetical protein cyc_07907 [Cyclospora cayetanensis]|uniref:Uncharacterized protein n=1 Tax=Cyclospora cayetanensis TaxID=88456 RepID=A0A1D3CS99_9EIME|nr:hypothetical protein cyc_07907 [Cyclospora cayetanensis]
MESQSMIFQRSISAPLQAHINGQETLALPHTEANLLFEEMTQKCSVPVHYLAQSRRLRLADNQQEAMTGKATAVHGHFDSE